MRASTLFLGFTVAGLAGALAVLWQALGPRSTPSPRREGSPPVAAAPPARTAGPRLTESADPGVRSVYPGGRPSAARPPQAEDEVRSSRIEAPAAPATPERSASVAPPPVEAAEPPASGEGVDLNAGSLEQLNGLGAGMIGRTIIANRPYASPDDLVARRVLSRRDYETIRPHVVVR